MRTKCDHYSFSRSKDMFDAHQNLNGSCDPTTPLSGMIRYPWLPLTMISLSTKFEVSISTNYKDMKGDTKNPKCGGLGLQNTE